MAEPKKQIGRCHDATASTPSGLKVDDHAVLYEGQLRVLYSVESITDFGRALENATTGWIESDAEAGIRKNAISGWKKTSSSTSILNSAVYTAHVLKVAEEISFCLPRHRFDNGWNPALPHQFGRFNACHIEKKLTLWWVEKALFFSLKTKNLSRMHELKDLELPARMARATVILNHEPCKNCLDFLDEIYRITSIRITTRQIAFLEPKNRTRVEEYPKDDEDEQDFQEDSPETPRPTVPRKASDPKVTKALTYSSPPKPWQRFETCAKPSIPTKVTPEEQRQMYGGLLPSHQRTSISRPREEESRSVCGKPDSSKPISQPKDGERRVVKNQHPSKNGGHSSYNPSRSPSATHLPPPLPSTQLEVQLPLIHPQKRAEYRRIESHLETTNQPSLAQVVLSSPTPSLAPSPAPEKHNTPTRRSLPNFKRFMYGGGVVTPAKRPTKETTRKPKGPTRAEKARKKSTFLKARERAERQTGQVTNGLEAKAQTPVPAPNTGDGAVDDDDDASMVPVHPSFLAECGLDVVMG